MNNTAPITICLIDDDTIYQLIIRRIIELTFPNQQVLCFENGQLALDYFLSLAPGSDLLPDIIFLDINMPVMNGWEFLDAYTALQQQPLNIPIYMVSSSVDESDAIRSRSYSVVKDFIVKPMNKVRICEILDSALGSNNGNPDIRNPHLSN